MPNHHESEIVSRSTDMATVESSRLSPNLGGDIRDLRKAKGQTLEKVADLTGLSIGFISQIERGLNRPSVTALFKISRALGVPVSWFFSAPQRSDEAAEPVIVRHTHRKSIEYSDGITDELLTPNLGGKLEMLSCTFAPGSGVDTVYSHEGEEAGVVISGKFDLWVGDTQYQLNAGDSFAFDSATPHRYRNSSDKPTVVIWAVTPPSF